VLSLLDVQISAAIALVATLFGFIAGFRRSRRAGSSKAVKVSRRPAGGTQLIWILGTLAAIFWPIGVFVVPAYAYAWPAFGDFPGSWALQIVGIALGISGGLLYSSSARALGAQMTPIIQLRQGDLLIQSGPYRFVRHPIYLSIILIAFGQSLLFLSPPAAVLTLVVLVLALYRARLEEGLLGSNDAFGSRYQTYVGRTGGFLPRFWDN
jgi:protein-S-isoprenylcysteine O-methyltransferase Ste14